MKRFKQIDLCISIVLIIVFAIISFIQLDHTFIIGYFIVGGWQVISMVTHSFSEWFTDKNSLRIIYHWLTFSVIILGLAAFVFPVFFWVLYIMLFISPLMAIFYAGMCYVEVKELSKRPLAVLK